MTLEQAQREYAKVMAFLQNQGAMAAKRAIEDGTIDEMRDRDLSFMDRVNPYFEKSFREYEAAWRKMKALDDALPTTATV